MPDLAALCLKLKPVLPSGAESAPGRPWWGRAAQGALLALARNADPALSRRLHAESVIHGYTASSLTGPFGKGGALLAGQDYWLRYTAFDPALAPLLVGWAARDGCLTPGARIDLDGQTFEICDAAIDATEYALAGQETYADLAARALVGVEPPKRQVSLHLASPTAFKSQNMHQPLPLSDLVFGSLLDRWNLFSPVQFPTEVKRFALECLAVSRFDIHTISVPLKNGAMRVGAMGQVAYRALNADRYYLSLLRALAEFSFYSGLGVNTTCGLGQCRVKDNS